MTTATTTGIKSAQTEYANNAPTTIPFENIQQPGCYVCNWSGHLLRVPEDGVCAGRSPLVNIIGTEPLFVTKISENPFMTLTKARMVASNWDINVNF